MNEHAYIIVDNMLAGNCIIVYIRTLSVHLVLCDIVDMMGTGIPDDGVTK